MNHSTLPTFTHRHLTTVVAVALNQVPLDWDTNLQNHKLALAAARELNPSVVLFPELSLPGYGCEDWFLSAATVHRSYESLMQLLPESMGIIIAVGLPVAWRGFLFNSMCLIANGSIIGFVPKQYLANDSVYYENRWFRPWKSGFIDSIVVQGNTYPIGDLLFSVDDYRIGFEICEDAWGSERPGAAFGGMGVNLILNPSMSHFAFGRHLERRGLVTESSRAYSCAYVYANNLGLHSGRVLADGGCFIASCGTMIAEGSRFSFKPFSLTAAQVDLAESARHHASIVSRRVHFSGSERVIAIPQVTLKRPQNTFVSDQAAWNHSGDYLRENELARATALGLADYLRKTKQQRAVISLSGGQDSSAVAVIVRLMVHFGIAELGLENWKKYLNLSGTFDSLQSEHEIMRELLCCVYQKSSNNSVATEAAAERLATELGARFVCWEIDELVGAYEQRVCDALGIELSWNNHDLARQNIQARVRSPGAWMLANVLGALLLTTSNRSEASIGYATMDGDTAGGWNPIGGVEKAYLSKWLRWMEQHGPDGLSHPFKVQSLALVLNQAPTAELRHGGNQTDEADLMPYPVLDAIERKAITQKLSPIDTFQAMLPEWGDHYSPEQLKHWVKKFYRLWASNQWKRERYAPSLLVDNQNLDPKTACRFPILSGGFIKEIDELN